jgi:hypothetical protein|tara:strand:- start:412 stop:594 length:183 start_codon:yes stop_codon:yes gene_type:complete
MKEGLLLIGFVFSIIGIIAAAAGTVLGYVYVNNVVHSILLVYGCLSALTFMVMLCIGEDF